MYHFRSDTQLRTVRRLLKSPALREYFARTRLVILEHILPTTAEFVRLLVESDVSVSAVIAKPFSVDSLAADSIKQLKIPLIQHSTYRELESSGAIEKALAAAIGQCSRDERRLILLDVGGYFGKTATAAREDILGIIEDTTFGHNRYLRLLSDDLRLPPICSVARSTLKQIEAKFVGRDAVVAVEGLLRRVGISITGRNALVLGYGMIGRNIARTLRGYGLNVYVYDIEDCKLLHAFNDGFHIHKKVMLLRHADIIFSATGSEALYGEAAMSLEEIEDCKNGVVLASAGSRDTEFAVRELKAHSIGKPEQLIEGTNDLVCYSMPNSKHVIVVRDGTAVNFALHTMPIEVLDLVFSEITLGIVALQRGHWEIRSKVDGTARKVEVASGGLNETPTELLDALSRDWLRSVNMETEA